MSKVTLEDVAGDLEHAVRNWQHLSLDFAGPKLTRSAALVRAADEVVKAATRLAEMSHGDWDLWEKTDPEVYALETALAAFDKISNGSET